ncbi:hypothetical protein A5649_13435 [Mycolicibacter heraklionensis]|uniref:Uncharacterized protein n=1 Tax=Mycolicibacter heraklionensis TaxID=512402 RepID=A0AA91EYI4_9MYCO|nr:hypothetical protein [Mycolicibacter heraklionensis]OBK89449.1 hypothetical protein A5649_13435 [Mycolicibacter heraklionensis]
MCVRGISGLLEVLAHWPWATIAAFLAAAATLYVGQSQINERRRLVGREAIAQLSAAVQGWISASYRLRHQNVPDSRSEYRQAAENLSRAILAVKMTCNDAELVRHHGLMLVAATDFSERVQAALSSSADELSEPDAAVLDALANDLDTSFKGVLLRALNVYMEPPRWRDRIPQWLRDRPPTPEQD